MIDKPCALHERHIVAHFECGVEALNSYLQNYARQNQKRDGSRTYVALERNQVIGYYTLVFGAIEWKNAPDYIKKGLGKYPVPILIIARLAVDKKWSGKGLGNSLLVDALQRAITASEIAGLKAVMVQAKNSEVEKFYEKHGFRAWILNPSHLFITIAELKREV